MNTIAQIFPRTGRISGPEVADGAKPDVPTTDVENKKNTKHRVFYEAVDAHARRRLKKHRPFYEAVDAHSRRRLKRKLLSRFKPTCMPEQICIKENVSYYILCTQFP